MPSALKPTARARRFNAARPAAFLAMTVFLTGSAFAQNAPPAQAPAQAQAQPAAAADTKPAEYVGTETCKTCHEDVVKAFQKNPHVLVESASKYKFETKACESCHGPGSKHAESASPADIIQPAKLKPAQTDRVCLTCHLNQQTQVGRINGSHAKNQVSCTSCHAIHGGGSSLLGAGRPAGLVAGIRSTAAKPSRNTEINQQCAGCHSDVWATFQRQFKHRLPEGAMACVDCHNPHGSLTLASAKANQSTFRSN
jgi:nitrate/TMAO reductase-like tetraheme cytochrome c subunit